jgi:hypothetical protein
MLMAIKLKKHGVHLDATDASQHQPEAEQCHLS